METSKNLMKNAISTEALYNLQVISDERHKSDPNAHYFRKFDIENDSLGNLCLCGRSEKEVAKFVCLYLFYKGKISSVTSGLPVSQ